MYNLCTVLDAILTCRQSGQKLQSVCIYGNLVANNFFKNWILPDIHFKILGRRLYLPSLKDVASNFPCVCLTRWKTRFVRQRYEKLDLMKQHRFHVADVWSEVDRRWRQNVIKMNKHLALETIAKCVTDFLTTFWGLLWSITAKTHGNLSIRWRPLKSSQMPNNPLYYWRTLYTKPTLFVVIDPVLRFIGLRSIWLAHQFWFIYAKISIFWT